MTATELTGARTLTVDEEVMAGGRELVRWGVGERGGEEGAGAGGWGPAAIRWWNCL